MSPAGSSQLDYGDSYVLAQEPNGALRAWSAHSNGSAVLLPAPGFQVVHGGGEVVLVIDQGGASGLLHAYSALTNTWSSVTIGFNLTSSTTARFLCAVREGPRYRAFSAYTGQWTTLAVATAGGFPQSLDNVAIADLTSAGVGTRQVAAFSAIRGVWALSPLYPSTGASAQVGNNVALVRTELPSSAQFAYAADPQPPQPPLPDALRSYAATSTVGPLQFYRR